MEIRRQAMNQKLLLVDDETDLLNSLSFVLRDYCSEILSATSGQEALEILAHHKIDCIVCDLNMPIMNGVELLKSLRKNGVVIPFIVFSAYNTDEHLHEVIKYGAFDTIAKPRFENLIESVKKGLNFSSTIENKFSDGVDFMIEYMQLLKEYKQKT